MFSLLLLTSHRGFAPKRDILLLEEWRELLPNRFQPPTMKGHSFVPFVYCGRAGVIYLTLERILMGGVCARGLWGRISELQGNILAYPRNSMLPQCYNPPSHHPSQLHLDTTSQHSEKHMH